MAGAGIADTMLDILKARKESKFLKTAQLASDADVARPEDFLVDKIPEPPAAAAIDADIESMQSYVEDSGADACPSAFISESFAADDVCEPKDEMKNEVWEMDAEAAHQLRGLGKLAGEFKMKAKLFPNSKKNYRFAADLVEATALNIKKEAIQKAASKMSKVEKLQKIASDIRSEGNALAADTVLATIEKIKSK